MNQRKRLAKLLSRTDYWTNQAVFDEAEKLYQKLVTGKMENAKRDRTGEKYCDYEIVGPADVSQKWIARCKCGYERIVQNRNMHKLKRCKKCAAKLRNMPTGGTTKKKDKFTDMQNWMAPKKPMFELDKLYRFNYYQCAFPCTGRLINEYRKTATFEIVECDPKDDSLIRNLGHRVVVKKQDAVEVA